MQAAELRIQLSEILLTENGYNILSKVLAATSLEEAMVKLEKAIPCLLHLENRSSEAIISRLVHRGWELREDSPEAIKQFIASVETLINERLFGSTECKSSWKFPLEDDGTMGDFKFANWRARRIMLHYNDLIEICLPDNERAEERNSWSSVATLYRDCIMVCVFYLFSLYAYLFKFLIANSKVLLFYYFDFSDAQIDAFQNIADDFFAAWLGLLGYDGITNYIHMLGAGHIRYFLIKWRNLNRFSNQ